MVRTQDSDTENLSSGALPGGCGLVANIDKACWRSGPKLHVLAFEAALTR